jgi:thiamine biosynthesis lipoprotein ApbE
MPFIVSPTRKVAHASVLGVLVVSLAAAPYSPQSPGEYRFSRDYVLGTSFDLTVRSPDAERAQACEETVLAEIERLRRILSTWSRDTEISLLNSSRAPMHVSRELLEVLGLCECWRERSAGAFNAQVGTLLSLWRRGDQNPDPSFLDRVTQEIEGPGVDLDLDRGTARRRTSQELTVDAVAKGYIIEKSIAAARAADPLLKGILLNIGGDIGSWGGGPWRIGVASPFRSHENAPPLAEVLLPSGRAIATSAFYERPGHILDPRTGRPARGVSSATAVAGDVATANAVTTTLCVMKPEEGLRWVRQQVPGTECLVVGADGRIHASPGWAALAAPILPKQEAKTNPKWPEKHQVTIELSLAENPAGKKKYRRPYVAVWIEDDSKKPVRTITVWGTAEKYLRDLTEWWGFASKDTDLVKAVTRATRNGGKYMLAWDGLDDKGQPLPRGTYTVRVEVHREHGSHIKDMAGKIECGAKDSVAEIKGNVEVDGVKLIYGPPSN